MHILYIYIYIYISCICLYNVITTLLQFLKDVIDGDGQRLVTRRSKRKKHWAVWTVLHVSWGDTCIVSLHVSKKHDPTHNKKLHFLPIVHNSLSAEVHQAQFIHAHKHKTHVNNRHIHLSMICVFLLFLRGKNGLALNAAFGHNTNCCCLKRAGSAHRLELKSHLLKKVETTRGGSCTKHVSQCVYLIVLRGG